MCHGKKRPAILINSTHDYALGEGLLRNRIHLPLAKNNTVLLGASAFIRPNVTNPTEFWTALKGTTALFTPENLSGELIFSTVPELEFL